MIQGHFKLIRVFKAAQFVFKCKFTLQIDGIKIFPFDIGNLRARILLEIIVRKYNFFFSFFGLNRVYFYLTCG
jgi:hypothetical protein